MKRLLILFLLCAAPLRAQTLTPSPQALTTQFSSTCTATSCATWPLTGVPTTFAAVTISVTGTFSGTLTFKSSVDGQQFDTLSVTKLSDGSSTTTTTATGQFSVANSGFQALRVEFTTLSSGGPNLWATRGGGVPKTPSSSLTRLYTGDGTVSLPAWSFTSDTDTGVYRIGSGNVGLSLDGTLAYSFAAGILDFRTDGGTIRIGADGDPVALVNDGADTLSLYRSTAPNTFRVYNTRTNASNYERANISWSANVLTVGATAAGTGTARAMNLVGATVSANGSFVATGVATAYKVARGSTAFDGSNPTTVATGLATVVSCTATLVRAVAITTGTAFVTHDTPSGANVDFYAWVIAGTASTATENFDWVCVGT